ncbi:2-oxoacid:acceptor oxidoreductase subunit alpha [Geoglobus acetivorans]|uniref:2-oxoacid ferredoxin oxidoreductase, subunit alpha n=1 Tax=Geoglobus acetivorans TaxID=565033 RepID=A0A0A7GD15_GEOAI|nr:2-oxoacid ferredoxin oxidoreductase, subunit alpha [Geoglobus acetivorans]
MDLNVCIVGAAGDGVKEAGELAAELFAHFGYSVFVYQEYQSIIRGGHNASIVRMSDREINSHRKYFDLMICLEDYAYELYRPYLRGDLIYDTKFKCGGIGIPMTEIIKEEQEPNIFRNAASLGALAAYLDIEFDILERIFSDRFGARAKDDITIAKAAYEYYRSRYDPKMRLEKIGRRKKLVSGAVAIAEGLISAGLTHFYAYPMTPASPILHYLIKKREIVAYQPESEIAAVGMAIGSAYAGKRSATGTSGGGFALMAESISLAGMAEIPLLVIEAQRTSPSTGMATYHGQEDLYFAMHPAHGEFPMAVACPYSVEEAFYLSAELMNIAWKYQIPAILLTDKNLVESYKTAEIERTNLIEEIEIVKSSEGEYMRYEVTESGISKYAVPPAIVKANSNEHDEFGITTDDASVRTQMHEKRMLKENLLREDIRDRAWKFFLKGKDTIVTWGSTFGPVYEVAEELGYRVAVPRYLRPFIKPGLAHAVVVEQNYTGQLAKLLEMHGVEVKRVNKWDGRPFTPDELRELLG